MKSNLFIFCLIMGLVGLVGCKDDPKPKTDASTTDDSSDSGNGKSTESEDPGDAAVGSDDSETVAPVVVVKACQEECAAADDCVPVADTDDTDYKCTSKACGKEIEPLCEEDADCKTAGYSKCYKGAVASCGCKDDADCETQVGDLSVCNKTTGLCGCADDSDCTVEKYGKCITATKTCGCAEDADCGEEADSKCLATGACGCKTDDFCKDNTVGNTKCDTATNTCVCKTDKDCQDADVDGLDKCYEGVCGCAEDKSCEDNTQVFTGTSLVCK